MKKIHNILSYIVYLIITITCLSISVVNTAYAVDIFKDSHNPSSVCNQSGSEKSSVCSDSAKAKDTNVIFGKDGVVTKGVQLFIIIVGVIAVFMILINAMRMILSGGDPNGINSARNGLLYAVIGVVIVLVAQAIVSFILKRL
ncbi:hypothetical protein KDA11_06975 [Candidatus Saccharibacteria bacterium]|nr:hypothetical protein [Candidatus Saccharibacteria bacterium]